MNNQRRKAIEELVERIDDIKSAIEEVAWEEQEYFDVMPESFQSGEKGEVARSAAQVLSWLARPARSEGTSWAS